MRFHTAGADCAKAVTIMSLETFYATRNVDERGSLRNHELAGLLVEVKAEEVGTCDNLYLDRGRLKSTSVPNKILKA